MIFTDEIPDPREVIIICLINTCDVFRFIFQLDDESEGRIELVCKMDLMGRSIAAAVSHNLAAPSLRRFRPDQEYPDCPRCANFYSIDIFATATFPRSLRTSPKSTGRCFQIRPPFAGPMIFLAGPQTNQWVHRQGRMYLRAKDYFVDFEKVLCRVWSVALPGWRRSFPASKGPVAGVVLTGGWKDSWTNSTNMPGNT